MSCGIQENPLMPHISPNEAFGGWGGFYLVTNRQRNVTITGTLFYYFIILLFLCLCLFKVAGGPEDGILPLIKNYGFYEGNTRYRVDPRSVYKLINKI